ncbi:MAG TPA: tyrosinase family protein [Solirubrobacteraceae bacterium]|nr:tyrosinase family protein [Solirubrobacteraceae bacterium]
MEATGRDVANAARLERDDLVHRKNAALLSDDEVVALRSAFEQIKQISLDARGDDRGFFQHAGKHGVPFWDCPHHTPQRIFLPWHRAYLYRLEQALADRVRGVTLPWWDWTTTREIPPPFADEEVGGAPNPLYKSRTLVTPDDIRDGAPLIAETFRDPHPPEFLPGAGELQAVMQQPSYAVFNDACEDIHDGVHGWVGGTMGNVGYAAFDPVFWVHHCMIDRMWWLWQQDNRLNAVASPGWEDIILEPFNLRVRDVLNANALGFDYADSETLIERQAGAGRPGEIIVCEPVPSQVVVPAAGYSTAHLEIGGIKHTGASYEGLVYINNPDADAGTGKDAEAGYVGSFHVFGHGGCFGAEGHCDNREPDRRRFDNRPLSRTIRMKKRVDITEPLRTAAQSEPEIQFTIVARTDDPDPEGVLDVKRLSVVLYR